LRSVWHNSEEYSDGVYNELFLVDLWQAPGDGPDGPADAVEVLEGPLRGVHLENNDTEWDGIVGF
jgi:hypothetical protein